MEPRPTRILIVEPNASVLSLIRQVLSESDYHLVHTDRLSDACELLNENGFDLVLLDLFLPDDQGIDCFVRIYAQAPTIPVLILTAAADEELAMQAVHAGAHGMIVKRRDTKEVIERKIDDALGSWLPTATEKDELTGLVTRDGFVAVAERYLNLASRTGKALLLFVADINDFASIKTLLGEEEADRALLDTTSILRATFRTSDLIARFGNDEFVALAIVNPADNGPEVITARLDEVLHSYRARKNRRFELGLTFAISDLDPEETVTAEEVVLAADSALFEALRNRQRA